MKTWAEFKKFMDDQYLLGCRYANRAGFPIAKSRGKSYTCVVRRFKDGSEDRIYDSGDTLFNGTKKQFFKQLEWAATQGEIVWFGVEGGWDGYKSVRDIADGEYEPWIGEWDAILDTNQLNEWFGWVQKPRVLDQVA